MQVNFHEAKGLLRLLRDMTDNTMELTLGDMALVGLHTIIDLVEETITSAEEEHLKERQKEPA